MTAVPTETAVPAETAVGIVGGGPAGLLLARLLHRAGVDCVLLESRDADHVRHRQRAGILEQGTVDTLRACGAGTRMDREGLPHHGIELRFDRRPHRIDFAALAGRSVMVYAQTEVVADLIALHRAAGPPLLFEAPVHAVDTTDPRHPVLRYRHHGRDRALRCDHVAGCDGSHGVTAAALPARRTFQRSYPYSWLGVLADVPPSTEELVYTHSPRGFALHSMRSRSVSRLYLQVPNGTTTDAWPPDRVWSELDARMALDTGYTLARGPITATAVLPMRAHVTEPMAHGRILLAGDAAHIVPPTGAKGLNLAMADAADLAAALARHHHTGDTDLLDAYSDTCLRRVWRAEHFSHTMTTMLHTPPDQDPFDTRLQLSALRRVATHPHAAADLAGTYTDLTA